MDRAVFDPFLQRLAWSLVHFLWQGALLGILAWTSLAILRRKTPQLRYGVACLFLVACALTPLITFMELGQEPRVGSEAVGTFSFRFLIGLKEILQTRLQVLLVIWTLGVVFLGVRALGAWFWLRRTHHLANRVLDIQWQACVDRLRRNRRMRRAVLLLETRRVRGPLTTGILRPVILVPMGFFASIDPVAAEAVLAHELAHIRRLDVLVLGLQTGIETLLFYHPAVWWISRKVRTEREHCCDDDAVQACGNAVLFARVLDRLDALREAPPALATGAGGGDLLERIKRLLAVEPGPVRFTAPGLSALLTAVLCATTLAAERKPVQHAIQQVVDLGSRVFDRTAQEAQGAQEAVRQFAPETPEPPKVLVSEVFRRPGLDDIQVAPMPDRADLSLAATPKPSPALPAPGRRSGADRLEPNRLGFEYSSFRDAKVEVWPEEVASLEAEDLPPYSYELSCLRNFPSLNGRLVKLQVPGRSKIILSASTLSSGASDLEFGVMFVHLRSLSAGPAPTTRTRTLPYALFSERVKGPSNAIINPSDSPQWILAVISGPKGTPYRVERSVRPVKVEQDPEAPMPWCALEAWPEADVVDSKDSPDSCSHPNPCPYAMFEPWGDRLLSVGGIPGSGSRDLEVSFYTVDHLRCLSVEVQPGERLQFKAKDGGRVMMEAITRRGDEDSAWMGAVERANHQGWYRRSRILDVTNPTDRVQKMVLVLYRLENLPDRSYEVRLERRPPDSKS